MNATRTITSARRILAGTAVVVGLSTSLTACSLDWLQALVGGGGATPPADATTTTVTAPAETTTTTAAAAATTTTAPTAGETTTSVLQTADGAEVYAQQCSSCHGPAGQGTGGAPPLNATYSAAHDAAETLTIVNDGDGGMPAYGGVLTEAEIAAVVQYVHEGLATQ